MKRLTSMITMLLLTALPVLAAESGNLQHPDQGQGSPSVTVQQQDQEQQAPAESEGRQLHRAYQQKREEMRARAAAAEEIRARNVSGNNPGQTGL